MWRSGGTGWIRSAAPRAYLSRPVLGPLVSLTPASRSPRQRVPGGYSARLMDAVTSPTNAGVPAHRSLSGPVVLLAGGVGGAKLAHGLQAHLGTDLVVVVNTADDVERHGLLVSPDHDTVMYTLAGIDNREWGWGIAGETFAAAEMLERYG